MKGMLFNTSYFLRRSRCAVGGFPGLSRNDAVRLKTGLSGRELVVVSEVALALKLQCLAMGIGGGCALDEAAA